MKKNQYVILIGATIIRDHQLTKALSKFASVIKGTAEELELPEISETSHQVLLMEIGKGEYFKLELINRLREKNPKMEIILLNGNGERELVALALNYGVKDVFRKPYKYELIKERVEALLKYKSN